MYKRSKLATLPLLFTLALAVAQTGSVAGKWTGVIVIDDAGGPIETPVELNLEQKGAALSGKIGRAGDPERVEIRNGKLEGGMVTFEAASIEASAAMKFSLTLQGEKLQGEMKGAAQGNDIVAKVSLSRAK